MEELVMDNQILSYYRGKKVFITGHTGFKGSWLMACLHEAGAVIKGYALKPAYENGLFDYMSPVIRFDSVIADIRDRDRLKQEISSFAPDFIFHLAAQPLVRRSYEIPAETFDINVTGTANLLEAATLIPGKCTMVIVTTDKVYENREQDVLYKEHDRLGGYDPYSASKACAEITVSAFSDSFFNIKDYNRHRKAVTTARAGNVIGGGDWSRDRIIPDIVRSLAEDRLVLVRNPKAVRPWQHVLEPVYGYLKLAMLMDKDPETYAVPFNFGPLAADHLPVKDLVTEAIKTWGSGDWTDISRNEQPHEAGLLKLDIQKAKDIIGWVPKLSAREAIHWTIDWYKQDNEGKAAFTFGQITDYLSR